MRSSTCWQTHVVNCRQQMMFVALVVKSGSAARLGTTSSSLIGASAQVLRPCGECQDVWRSALGKGFAHLGGGRNVLQRRKFQSPSIEALGLRSSVRWAEVAFHATSYMLVDRQAALRLVEVWTVDVPCQADRDAPDLTKTRPTSEGGRQAPDLTCPPTTEGGDCTSGSPPHTNESFSVGFSAGAQWRPRLPSWTPLGVFGGLFNVFGSFPPGRVRTTCCCHITPLSMDFPWETSPKIWRRGSNKFCFRREAADRPHVC